jgi:FtsP/CotA-like multicopper oxidase with cupredoxin domain
MTADEMDAMNEARVQAFLDNVGKTRGFPEDASFTMDGDVKVFEFTVDPVQWETEPGIVKSAIGYNGLLPGPTIRVTEGDRIRATFTNNLEESTTVHWHGINTPNDQDGVPFVTQPPIKPGATYTYEFVAEPVGSHMYHSHHNAADQVGRGLLGAFIVEPRDMSTYPAYDHEYIMVLNDGYNGFTINGKGFPNTQPLTAKVGETILVRYMNEGIMYHPMHLHGMPQEVYALDGYPLPAPYLCDTVDVAPGNRFDVFIKARAPGLWAFHCHILTHAERPEGMFGLVTVLIVEE